MYSSYARTKTDFLVFCVSIDLIWCFACSGPMRYRFPAILALLILLAGPSRASSLGASQDDPATPESGEARVRFHITLPLWVPRLQRHF